MANNVEDFSIIIKGDTTDASSALVALNNQLQGLQSNLIKLERQTKNYSKEFGDGSNTINSMLGFAIPKINEINKLLSTGATGWGDIKDYVTETNNEMRTYENLIGVVTKQLKEQKALQDAELKNQREYISLQNTKNRINSIDVTSAQDKLSSLQMQKRELQDNIRLARQFGDSDISILKLSNALAEVSKKISIEKLAIAEKTKQKAEAQAKIDEVAEAKKVKSTLEINIERAKSLVLQNAEANLLSTTVGKMQIKAKQMEAELNILLRQEQSEANLARIEALRNKIGEQGVLIRAQATKEQGKEAQYDGVLSMHSAKRAVGYSVLFGAIALVVGGMRELVVNAMEADLQMRTMAAVLKLNVDQARGLSDSIRDLGNTYGGSLKEIEGVALALARAGVASKDMVSATEIVLRMARLTGDTFEQSASAIISFQQVFGRDTKIEVLGNKLAYIANMSRLSTQDIGTFANYALAAGKAAGLTEDSIGGLATAFSNAGVNASTIGTQIRTFTGVLTENSKDVTDFFLGIGVNQKGLAAEVQKGGEASNRAIMEFVEILSKVDKATFNNLTGNMDKLTGNVLSLLRNNKDNILTFTKALQDGAEGQLGAVDVILDAHRVSLEKMWNSILNTAQQGISDLEALLTDTNLADKIKAIEETLSKQRSYVPSVMDIGLGDNKTASTEDLTKKLAELKTIQQLKEDNLKVSELQAKIDKSSGEEFLKLSEEKRALLVKIAEERASLETKTVSKSKEQIAEEIKTRETELEITKKSIENLDNKSNKYTTLTKYIKDQEDALKQLKKTTEEVADIKLAGSDYATLGKDIMSKYSAEEVVTAQELLNYNNAIAKAKENLLSVEERYYKNASEKNAGEIESIKTIMQQEDGLAQLRAIAEQAVININDLNANKIQLSKEDKELQIATNNAFINALGQLEQIAGARSELMRNARSVSEAQKKDAQDLLELNFNLNKEALKQNAIKSGGKGSDIIQAEINALKTKYTTEQASNMSKKDIGAWQLSIAQKQTEKESAIVNEKNKALSSSRQEAKEASRILELQGKVEIAKAKINGIALSEVQLAEKMYQVEMQKAAEQEKGGLVLEAEVTRYEAMAKLQDAQKKDATETLKGQIDLAKVNFSILEENLKLKGMEIPIEERVTTLRKLASDEYELQKQLAEQILDPKQKSLALANAELNYKKDLNTAQDLLIKKEKELIDIRSKVSDLERSWAVTLGNAKELTDVEKEILEIETKIAEKKVNKQDVQPDLDRLEALKEQQKSYTGINKAIIDYQAKAKDLDKTLEGIANNTISSMESNMMNFFDATSEGWLDWHSLVSNILTDIYKQLLQELVIKQMVSGIAGGIGGMFAPTPTVPLANGGMIPTKGYASGGLLTGGSGMRDDLYLGNVGGTRVFAMGGEFITKQSSVNASTRPTLDYINQTGNVPSADIGGGAVSVNTPISINIENQTGQAISADMIESMTKTNDKGEYEKVVNIVLKASMTDPRMRSLLKGR